MGRWVSGKSFTSQGVNTPTSVMVSWASREQARPSPMYGQSR